MMNYDELCSMIQHIQRKGKILIICSKKRFEKSEDDKRVKIEKTIRLRWHHIEDWICDTDIKVRCIQKPSCLKG